VPPPVPSALDWSARRQHSGRLFVALALLGLAAGLACSDGDVGSSTSTSPAATATATATSSASPTDTPSASPTTEPGGSTLLAPRLGEPDAARGFDALEMLAGTIGPRPAGTESEREAAEFLRDELAAAGYQATIEEFPIVSIVDNSEVRVAGEGQPIAALALEGSFMGEASGSLVEGGLGAAGELALVEADGAIVVVDRGDLTFAEKARNAEAAGAVGLIVVNNEPGFVRGSLGDVPISIPVVAVASGADDALRGLIGGATEVTVVADVTEGRGSSQNVVGRPGGGPCRAYLGAHYDSVPQGPGANDNASGTALMVELARSNLVEGLCVVAFGSEEIGLFGSEAFVAAHREEVRAAEFMLNFDMVAKLTAPRFVMGDRALAEQASALAAAFGLEMPPGTFGPFASSDHASFEAAGVPAITFYSGNDEFIHTGRDDVANVSEADFARLLAVGNALLRQLLELGE
jgi:Zn-dependent M28 family amino/carboxypeptidase